MNKYLLIFTLVIVLLQPSVAMAKEKAAENTPEEIYIESLIHYPSNDFPYNLLIPVPTPSIRKSSKKEIGKDKRSWTKYQYKDIINTVAQKYKLDPQVIYATIMTESEGDTYAFRYEPHLNDASLGLGQILTKTAKSLGFKGDPKDLYKPEISIDMIGKYHRYMLDTYGGLTPTELAIAYNSGSPRGKAVKGHISRFNFWYSENAI